MRGSEPSSTAFPGAVAGTFVGSGPPGTWTDSHISCRHRRWWSNLLCHSASRFFFLSYGLDSFEFSFKDELRIIWNYLRVTQLEYQATYMIVPGNLFHLLSSSILENRSVQPSSFWNLWGSGQYKCCCSVGFWDCCKISCSSSLLQFSPSLPVLYAFIHKHILIIHCGQTLFLMLEIDDEPALCPQVLLSKLLEFWLKCQVLGEHTGPAPNWVQQP